MLALKSLVRNTVIAQIQEILRNMVYSPRVSTERWITKTKAEVTYPFGGKSKEEVPSFHTEK